MNGPLPIIIIAVIGSPSVSVSFANNEVALLVVIVTVPPSLTNNDSVTVTGGSFTAVTVTTKTS